MSAGYVVIDRNKRKPVRCTQLLYKKKRINKDRIYSQRRIGAMKAAYGTNKNFEKITYKDDCRQKIRKNKKTANERGQFLRTDAVYPEGALIETSVPKTGRLCVREFSYVLNVQQQITIIKAHTYIFISPNVGVLICFARYCSRLM